jgi:hypothetical protein
MNKRARFISTAKRTGKSAFLFQPHLPSTWPVKRAPSHDRSSPTLKGGGR